MLFYSVAPCLRHYALTLFAMMRQERAGCFMLLMRWREAGSERCVGTCHAASALRQQDTLFDDAIAIIDTPRCRRHAARLYCCLILLLRFYVIAAMMLMPLFERRARCSVLDYYAMLSATLYHSRPADAATPVLSPYRPPDMPVPPSIYVFRYEDARHFSYDIVFDTPATDIRHACRA